MGFTRYFNGNVTITPELVQDVQNIVANSGVAISGWDGTGEPQITLEEIRLNGTDDESCETFAIINGDNHNFCKTNREPYDIVVAAVLKRVSELNQNFNADSDGGNEEEAVANLYNTVFGK